ncbi:MAG: SRPBCC family protein [Leptolyngbya sp. SIO1D8]|nr:SRPBCC family protein [Leptolyngbya sp. SIO1D8]
MKYTNKVEINLPVDQVVKLWQNHEHFDKWQTGYLKTTLLEGEASAQGSKSEILLCIKGKEMRLIQTVLISNLPEEKKILVEHEHMTNTLSTRFKELNNSRTECISETEYTKFNGLIPKVMATLFPGIFRQQSQKWLDNFKEFAENNVHLANT